jgi:hypothetical protein
MAEKRENRYRYRLKTTWALIIPCLSLLLIGIALLPRGIKATLSIFLESTKEYPTKDAILFIIGPCLVLYGAGVISTLYTEIIITDLGMKVRILIFKWRFIPWQDVLGISPPVLGGSYNVWRLIIVRQLTLFHRIVSLVYRTDFKPVLLICSQIQGYNELIRTIEEHVEDTESVSRVL